MYVCVNVNDIWRCGMHDRRITRSANKRRTVPEHVYRAAARSQADRYLGVALHAHDIITPLYICIYVSPPERFELGVCRTTNIIPTRISWEGGGGSTE